MRIPKFPQIPLCQTFGAVAETGDPTRQTAELAANAYKLTSHPQLHAAKPVCDRQREPHRAIKPWKGCSNIMMTIQTFGRTLTAGCLMSVAGLSTTQAWSQTYSLTLLPSDMPNTNLRALARGISGDGNVIVGSGSAVLSPLEMPYTWRKVDGVWTRRQLFTFGAPGRAVAAS